jgi:transcriptional regulator GlxA family with amidase domain
MKTLDVGIFLFEDVEVLDFAGPFEVFSVTEFNQVQNSRKKPFQVTTFSEKGQTIFARNGLKIQPDYSFHSAPHFDIIIIPGGPGTLKEFKNKKVIEWISKRIKSVQIMASVCTGVFLLAEAGLLVGKRATTHWASLKELESRFPETTVVQNVKFVDEDNIFTAAGVSAGINMSLHIVKRLLDIEVAKTTAKLMEYDIHF